MPQENKRDGPNVKLIVASILLLLIIPMEQYIKIVHGFIRCSSNLLQFHIVLVEVYD